LSQGAGADMIAAGAVFGSAAGGAAGLVVMLLYWRNHRKRLRRQGTVMATVQAQTGELHPAESNGALLKALLRYALPVCLGALAVPLISLVDTFTVPRLLKQEGLDDTAVMVAFGVYNRGLPLVQLVMMFATTLSALFIPSLAEARVTGGTELARRQCEQSLRWFWLLGLAAATGLIVLAVPVNV
ncbi:oligosaccharide flippase family protein, partial [Bacillus cereus]|nr:oligosaccharide flippase family protein [Bacillus cereus]